MPMAETTPSDKDRIAETKSRMSKYVQVMRKAAKDEVYFAFGVGVAGKVSQTFLMVHELKTPKECLDRIKAQAREWAMKIEDSAAHLGTLRQDPRGYYVFHCDRQLRNLKRDLKAHLTSSGYGSLKFRLEAPGESDSDDGDGTNPDVSVAQGTTASNGGTAEPRMGDPALYKKATTAWTMTRELVQKDLDKFVATVVSEASGEPDAGAIVQQVSDVRDDIVKHLDSALLADLKALSEAADAGDGAGFARAHGKVMETVRGYQSYRRSQPVLVEIDDNPYVSVEVQGRLERTLDLLEKWLA
jgi:hypothetical protein